MSTTVTTPEPTETCAYCDARIFDHDPVCVRDRDDGCGSPVHLCNYACLSVYIDENDPAAGDARGWTPGAGGCY